MEFSAARQLFYQEIQQPDEQINLAKAALYIAQEEYPDLDVEQSLETFDVMAEEVRQQLPPERYPLRIIKTINQYLFDDLGFRGNTDDYYDPRNSFLSDVIVRRTGIPITLSLVYLEVARRIDFPMVGIGMPGHFIIRPDFADAGIFVDAFNRGEILFAEDWQPRLSQLYGQPVQLRPEFFAPVTSRQFLARMLMNLKMIYLQQMQAKKCLGVIDRILLLFPDAPDQLRDRGLLYYQSDRWSEARQDLESYLAIVPDAADAAIVRQLLDHIS
ncbi:SirB1 family protein [Planktothricoides raciborskii]|uniref:Tetratricopeptide repeat protein n=2 Tax=Planktothricoides raciborskii TaxID=132608 RepID=A0AAU8JFM6_9CYAN|nr:tetratricopeptide repeat protein [Planktothricoides raciborskii]MBD2547543.1 tetratricopeptide repeat protein [Planktothricoides raciborskii FACHB-1370]MBD2586020.1 tetratricopeptide repeat protein [Planktothricoides raciborskii FACHB-1261]